MLYSKRWGADMDSAIRLPKPSLVTCMAVGVLQRLAPVAMHLSASAFACQCLHDYKSHREGFHL